MQKDIAEKDRKIGLLRRHLALRREREEEEAREAERLTRDAALRAQGNGTCRWPPLLPSLLAPTSGSGQIWT
jgi:hypothetical protein